MACIVLFVVCLELLWFGKDGAWIYLLSLVRCMALTSRASGVKLTVPPVDLPIGGALILRLKKNQLCNRALRYCVYM